MHLPTSGRLRAGFVLVVVLGIALFGAMTGCGGGGGGGVPEPPPLLELGTFSATLPTRVSRTFLNPLPVVASISAPASTGPFQIDPDDLPAQAGGGTGATLGILFTPTGPGEATGFITVRFTGGGQVADEVFEVRAVGESLDWTVTPNPLDFGDVLPGEERVLEVTLRNDSQRSPVTLTTALIPSSAITLVPSPLPLTVQPGQSVPLTVRYAPTDISGDGGILRLGNDDVGGPVDIQVWANSTGTGERVIDLGNQPLTNGVTAELNVSVPETAVSLTLEGTMGEGDQVGLSTFVGPGGRVYENEAETGPLLWKEEKKTFSIHIPSSDQASTQLVSGGGTYRFRLRRISGGGSSMAVRVIIELRANRRNDSAVLPLNIYLADGLVPSAASAPNDTNLQSMLTQMGQILSAQGITVGDIDYYDIANTAFDQVAQGEEEQLFQLSGQAAETRLNLFLVSQVWGGQLLGVSGSIDGSKRNGDRVTGVVSLYFEGNPGAIAAVVAHEMCHYLGLWHTVESTGVWDEINDTPNCPPFGTSPACSVEGGDLLMHWQGNGGTILSDGQGLVLRGHPLMRPPGQGQAKPKIGPWTPDQKAIDFFRNRVGAWCGTRR